jgi:lysine 2,3-aminomutase
MNTDSQVVPTWKEEFKTSLRSSKELAEFLEAPLVRQPFATFIPRSFAQKIKNAGINSPLWNQFVPKDEENNLAGFHDPIGDKVHAKDNGIIHRYKNRVLFSPTTICPVSCRYCFRKNELNLQEDFLKASTHALLEYLEQNHQVEEVILTGGDPLILSNEKLEQLINSIAQIRHIKYFRIHTRTPIIIPSRIDDGLLNLLQNNCEQFESFNFVIHTNHCSELTLDVCQAIKKLAWTSVNLLSQSVLLKDVNDSPAELINLFKLLNKNKVRPYYLHHPDQVLGAMHFYLSLTEGRKIYAELRDQLPGWLIPHYVVDSPMGHGKSLAFNPESFEFSGKLIDRQAQLQPHHQPT